MGTSLLLRSFLVLLGITLIGGCGQQAGTATSAVEVADAPAPKYSAEAFFATTSYGLAGGLAYSPDNSRLLIHSDKTGIFNVYALPVDGGDAVALTESDSDAMFAVSWFPTTSAFCSRSITAVTSSIMLLFVRSTVASRT